MTRFGIHRRFDLRWSLALALALASCADASDDSGADTGTGQNAPVSGASGGAGTSAGMGANTGGAGTAGGAAGAAGSSGAGGTQAVEDAGPAAQDSGPARDASADPGDAGGGAALTFTRFFDEVIDGGCATGTYCHTSGSGMLPMYAKETAYMELVDQLAKGEECGDGVRRRVVPGDPDASLLIQKLEGSPPCGEAMPLDMPALAPELIAGLRAWIAAGAPND